MIHLSPDHLWLKKLNISIICLSHSHLMQRKPWFPNSTQACQKVATVPAVLLFVDVSIKSNLTQASTCCQIWCLHNMLTSSELNPVLTRGRSQHCMKSVHWQPSQNHKLVYNQLITSLIPFTVSSTFCQLRHRSLRNLLWLSMESFQAVQNINSNNYKCVEWMKSRSLPAACSIM